MPREPSSAYAIVLAADKRAPVFAALFAVPSLLCGRNSP